MARPLNSVTESALVQRPIYPLMGKGVSCSNAGFESTTPFK